MLTDIKFDQLMALDKIFKETQLKLPEQGTRKDFEVISMTTRDSFKLDVDRRGKIELKKSKIQNRYLITNEPLIRIELNAPPHQNPDNTVTSRDHIHIYKEGYGLSWAYDLTTFNPNLFKDIQDFNQAFFDFCSYCNIKEGGGIQITL